MGSNPTVAIMAESKGDLITKYRPVDLKEVLGQEAVCESIARALDKKNVRAFSLTGPSGVGKTTVARIIAAKVGCERRNLIEVDAATNTGVDEMRRVTESMQFAALGASPTKVYIVDEAHMLSRAAWNSLLKAIEEPPEHVYWVFCTTESIKIPDTIRTRCACYEFKPVKAELIYGLLKQVANREELGTDKDVLYLIAEKAQGSVRRALAGLSQCAGCQSRKEAAKLLQAASEEGEVIDLCRALMKGEDDWGNLMTLCKPLVGINGESIRLTIVGFFTKVLLSSNAKRAAPLLSILSAFSDPYPSGATIYPVMLSLGRLAFAAEER